MTTTMTARPSLYQTTIGRKVLMAVSGAFILLWVTAHMLGNLHSWQGAGEFNDYAHYLRRIAQPPFPHTWVLWIIRILLIAAFAVHVYYAIQLGRRSRAARVTRYEYTDHVQADPAALTMRWGGLTLGAFIIFHLMMFTWGWIHPGYNFEKSDPYHNVVGAFGEWWIVVLYAIALFALAMHIYHGFWSIFQTFGVNNRRWDRLVRVTATGWAALIFVGFMSVPIAVALGGIS
jgi:succinate dehydrogenase / fumarate reductase cytochrome b subunit